MPFSLSLSLSRAMPHAGLGLDQETEENAGLHGE